MVPVDGSVTLDLDGMIEVLTALKAPLMIPMHYFSTYTLHRFLEPRAREVRRRVCARCRRSWCRRPRCRPSPKVLVLPGH